MALWRRHTNLTREPTAAVIYKGCSKQGLFQQGTVRYAAAIFSSKFWCLDNIAFFWKILILVEAVCEYCLSWGCHIHSVQVSLQEAALQGFHTSYISACCIQRLHKCSHGNKRKTKVNSQNKLHTRKEKNKTKHRKGFWLPAPTTLALWGKYHPMPLEVSARISLVVPSTVPGQWLCSTVWHCQQM